ncbi:hypothetical protein [Methylobacterium dankookense]|uniref:Uncharacterized protein n=1 Tax=Methylobacterium dankookense TaxID=560405 RepID=A0A564G2Z6_9HYPH|nr:hypothetical protein [Methylobacterium dankookense]GJD59575.1 hypothetical protein IFDJLNFL_5504 [Methylobacterium dankookense]VUF13981.1 hypothetical protein MTDSW087_03691 [Methylobacterium dankookense]
MTTRSTRTLAAALVAAVVATPAFAQGIDSRHSPYPASAYPGFVAAGHGPAKAGRATAPAYRFSGQHAGGPADLMIRN